MSNYEVQIGLGAAGAGSVHSWLIDDGDVPDPGDTTQVLDGLTIGWTLPEAEPFPTQPDPMQARLTLLLDDVAELEDIGVGDIGNITVRSAGNVIAQFSGRMAQPTARPVRLVEAGVTVQKVRYEIPLVDFLVDLVGVRITAAWPAETAAARAAHIQDAILAAGGPVVNLNMAAVATAFEAAVITNQTARDVLDAFLAQVNDDPAATGRRILRAAVVDDTGAYTVVTDTLTGTALVPTAPGVLSLVANKLSLVFDGASSAPAGLVIDAGRVDEDSVAFTALKYAAVSKVRVASATALWGTVEAANGLPGVQLDLVSDLTNQADADAMADLYLPAADDTRWTMDNFTWRPTDADLSGLDYPFNVPSQGADATSRRIPAAQVVVNDIATHINPGNDNPFYAGTLSSLLLTIKNKTVLVTGRLARRLNTSNTKCVTIADIGFNFPTVKIRTGTNFVDPTLSIYEAKLARKM